ncbi:DUF4127 family protein [Anoxybacterium hadale]|uniref:DUF4127 family protein n=1 Tax=Anoxybacterium hadale TaxID=3408580 RepID=A0ACD1ABA0_9FIRM|nr:DUF4127 family protein [Clostridiales bacterium]
MKTKALSILLCTLLVLSAVPGATINAWAETGGGEPILAYVPLDNRPVNVDRVIYEAESAGFKVVMPDQDLYATRLDGQPLNSNGTPYGDREKLMKWITEMDKQTDYFVISLDQLLSGGLVNSRSMTNRTYTEEFKLIDAVVELSKNNQVYILDTVARLATSTVGYQGEDLASYNILRQYSLTQRPELKGGRLTVANIIADYDYNSLGRFITVEKENRALINGALRTRARKLNLIDNILTKDSAGNMKYFIGIDDSNSQSTIQDNEISYIKKKLGERGLIYSGTDELGMMAVLSLMIDYYGYDVKAAPVYFGDTEKSSSGSAYDMETVAENLENHLKSIGVRITEPKDSDLEIVVLTAPAQASLSSKYMNRTIDYINGNIEKGIPTIVINSNPSAYGGNLEYRMIRECEMSMLLSYSSWNTVGNSIGLALGNGISRYLYLHSRAGSSDNADIAFLKGLAFSYAKDISYQRGGGKDIFNKYLASKGWSASNFYQSEDQVAEVNLELEKLLKTAEYNVTVQDIINNMNGSRYFKSLEGGSGIIGTINLSNYSAPFFRTFEIRFDIGVKLNNATLSGLQKPMSISIPYQPQEGQLTYSVTLYYLDKDGKVHKIPSTYNKETGAISFATGLSGFFTEALSMDAAKAYSLFSDVPASSWYFDYVMFASEKGLMKGTGEGTFEPNAAITQSMLVQILYNMAGSPKVDSADTKQDLTESTKPDTESASQLGQTTAPWYANAAEWAFENKIITDNGKEDFAPAAAVTREQLADILWRYAKYKGVETKTASYPGVYHYNDAYAVKQELRDGFDWVCKAGIMQGKGDGSRLMPQAGATRAEVAVVLKRLIEL